MKTSLKTKLKQVVERCEEIKYLLADTKIIADADAYKKLNKEFSDLSAIVDSFNNYQQVELDVTEAESLLKGSDVELKELAKEQLARQKPQLETLTKQLQLLLLPKDADDQKNVFLEIRAGTGGDEASIFVGDLFRMYSKYIETKNWQLEILSAKISEQGGYKEIICRVAGESVYSKLKFESGTHRVQRVPKTESQGRVHTSACTIAILVEPDALDAINIDKGDYRLDTFRASGKGGQHVNKTDSAIRITHFATGLVVECQEGRSQHKNKAKALAVLQAKLNNLQKQQQQNQHSSIRKQLVGSGDRSGRIRTYNFPQGRLTDHRINLTIYNLDSVMEGDLDLVIKPLTNENQAQLLLEYNND